MATKRQSRLMRGSMALQRGSIASKQMSKRMSKAMSGRMSTAMAGRMSMAGGGKGAAKPTGPPAWLRHSNKGDVVWVPDKDEVYVGGVATGMSRQEGLTLKMNDGTERKVPLDKLYDLQPGNDAPSDDMCSLANINAAAILQNLQERAAIQASKKGGERAEAYTFMSNVLVAINPLDMALTDPPADSFIGPTGDKRPHPYGMAEVAYKQLCSKIPDAVRNQSVVVSGESGSGKTEAAKIALRILVKRGGGAATGLDQKILGSNPVLESFGNAKTFRNHNSSRFGKFMKLQFNAKSNQLTGGLVETYLLEKSRITFQTHGERNYHIFYQMLTGLDAAHKAKLELGGTANDYPFLNKSGCVSDPRVNDEKNHAEFAEAVAAIGVEGAQLDALYELLAAVLHLGSVEFEDTSTSEGDVASAIDRGALEKAARMLGVEAGVLESVMAERVMVTMGEKMIIKRNAASATQARDAVVRELYSRIFDWSVATVNVSLGEDADPAVPFIGVLDIFGFETFAKNDFEQLLINYTNEVLQALFNAQVFQAEAELFRSEGIIVAPIVWPDNRECVELIASKPNGVLCLLDAETRNPKASDLKFNASFHKMNQHNPFSPRPHAKDIKEQFLVKHFAGNVTYTVGSFVNKNNNVIPSDIGELFVPSSLKRLSEKACAAPEPPKRGKKPPTVSGVFSGQIAKLVDTLNGTRCSFIRCIKPNLAMQFGVFDRAYVMEQLTCQGVMQTCEVLKLGMPTRVAYAEIARRFRDKLPAEVSAMFADASDLSFCTAIMWAFEVGVDDFKCGLTKMFFKAGQMGVLEEVLECDWAAKGDFVTARLKKFVLRRRWRKALACVIAQNIWIKHFKQVKARRDAATKKLQALFRGKKGREEAKKKMEELLELRRAQAEAARLAEEAARRKAAEEAAAARAAALEKAAAEKAAADAKAEEQEAERRALAADAEAKKAAARAAAAEKQSTAATDFAARRAAMQAAQTKMKEKAAAKQKVAEDTKESEARALKADAEAKKARAAEDAARAQSKSMSSFEARRAALQAAQGHANTRQDAEAECVSSKAEKEAAEREALLAEAEWLHAVAEAEAAEKEASETATFQERRTALLKAQDAAETVSKTGKEVAASAKSGGASATAAAAAAGAAEEQARSRAEAEADALSAAMLQLEQAMDQEEAARAEAEQSWFSWQDDAGAKAEEQDFEREEAEVASNKFADGDWGDIWDDDWGGGETFYQSAYDETAAAAEPDWGGGNADDEEMFLLALLASMGICGIDVDDDGAGGAGGMEYDDGGADLSIDTAVTRAFDELTMRQQMRGQGDKQVQFSLGGTGAGDDEDDEQYAEGSEWEEAGAKKRKKKTGFNKAVRYSMGGPRKLSTAGAAQRGSIFAPPPRKISSAVVKDTAKRKRAKRRQTGRGPVAETMKGQHLVRVNELLADGDITVDQAEELYDEILNAPDDAPFPELPEGAEPSAKKATADEDWGGALGPGGEEEPAWWKDEKWTPEVIEMRRLGGDDDDEGEEMATLGDGEFDRMPRARRRRKQKCTCAPPPKPLPSAPPLTNSPCFRSAPPRVPQASTASSAARMTTRWACSARAPPCCPRACSRTIRSTTRPRAARATCSGWTCPTTCRSSRRSSTTSTAGG